MLLGLLAASLVLPATTHELVRGGSIPGQELRYWAVEDTTLDASQSEVALGGRAFLQGGPGKAILIRFGDLQRALGPRRRILSAELRLRPAAGTRFVLRSASQILVPWSEGPAQVVNFANPGAESGPTPKGAATHRHRRAGARREAWQGPGCSGAADARPIAGATGEMVGDSFVVRGIEPAIQAGYDSRLDVGGLCLRFEESVEFFSSQAPSGRPMLVVTTEPEPSAAQAADLAVVHITRSIDGQIPALPDPHLAPQDGKDIPVWPPQSVRPDFWPAAGTMVTYTATVYNLGAQAIQGFRARWALHEEWGAFAEYNRVLEPGASTTLSYQAPMPAAAADHRFAPIAISLESKAVDADLSNNVLEIQQLSRTVRFEPTEDVADGIFALQCQEALDFLNRSAFVHSRFSFAPDGVIERLDLHSVGPSAAGPAADVTVRMAPNLPLRQRARLVLEALGLPAVAPIEVKLESEQETVIRRPEGLATGLTGRGDTRFDGSIPKLIDLNPEPMRNDILRIVHAEATDLLSMVEVAILNEAAGRRGPIRSAVRYRVPEVVLMKLSDAMGRPLVGATIEGFPVLAGTSALAGDPVFRVSSGPGGAFSLPNRQVQSPHPDLKPNVFGRIDAMGANGLLLLRVTHNEQVETAWLRLDHLVAVGLRAPVGGAVIDIRTAHANQALETTNLALNRITTDSVGSLPAQMAAWTDGNAGTAAVLPVKPESWIELDLGRDRVIGEIRLTVPDGKAFWKDFSIRVYATGSTPAEGVVWADEMDADWNMRTTERRRKGVAGRDLVYRGAAQRIRFIRIVNRTERTGAELAEFQVFGARPTP